MMKKSTTSSDLFRKNNRQYSAIEDIAKAKKELIGTDKYDALLRAFDTSRRNNPMIKFNEDKLVFNTIMERIQNQRLDWSYSNSPMMKSTSDIITDTGGLRKLIDASLPTLGIIKAQETLYDQIYNSPLYNSIKCLSKEQQVDWHSTSLEVSRIAAALVKENKVLQELNSPMLKKVSKGLYGIGISSDLLRANSMLYQTKEISNLFSSFADNRPMQGIEEFSKCFNSVNILAPNIAVLKLNTQLFDFIKGTLSSNIVHYVKSTPYHVASIVGRNGDLYYSSNLEAYYYSNDPDNLVTARETEVLCSGMAILNGITHEEMTQLLFALSNAYSLGSTHVVGRKILEQVRGWKDFNDLTEDTYYHGRQTTPGICPYIPEMMSVAPLENRRPGRFNYCGMPAFYFCDTADGVRKELSKHSKPEEMQIDKITPRRHVKMVDISGKDTSAFLEHCRYPVSEEDAGIFKREYLVPSFFADCCRESKIDGIKYNGDDSYNNYVTWEDHFKHEMLFDN